MTTYVTQGNKVPSLKKKLQEDTQLVMPESHSFRNLCRSTAGEIRTCSQGLTWADRLMQVGSVLASPLVHPAHLDPQPSLTEQDLTISIK